MKTKPEKLAYQRAYYAANKERIKRYILEWRKSNPDKVRSYQRRYATNRLRSDPEFRERIRLHSRDMYRKNRAKMLLLAAKHNKTDRGKARFALRNAVRSGKLVRPEKCDACKSPGRIQAHHEDYSRPLSVVWLCPLCHGKVHQKG